MTYPRTAVNQALALLPTKMDTPQARIQLVAIGFQESKFVTRLQYGGGPAHSYWQFEKGGIKGVIKHKASKELAEQVCIARSCAFTADAVWNAMAYDDALGAVFARLLMYTDAAPVPENMQDGWAMYVRTWRPGKPRPDEWVQSWAYAVNV